MLGFVVLGFVPACAPRAVSLEPADLATSVTIERDTHGVPHIRATSEEAAAFGFGYAQAEDHAEELARRLIEARGESAKYFGDADGAIANDLAMARFDNLEASRRDLGEVGPMYRRMLEAFAAGVNLYVSQHRAGLPSWIPTFTAADVQANARGGAASSLGGDGIARQLERRYRTGSDTVETEDILTDLPGSNALAIAGSRTTTGKPILLGNPHLAWSRRYWEAHVIVPGRINFYGSTLVGIPVLRAGFNDRLGFVQTNNRPDLEDIYALPMVEGQADTYSFEGRPRKLERVDVSIDVRNPGGTFRKVTGTYWNSHVGPIVHRTPQRAFAARSIRLESPRYFEGFYHASKARSLREFLQAMRQAQVPTSNFTYADADGNILYLWNARLPRRVDPSADYALDVPGDTGRLFWRGLHALGELPQLLNPAGGYIQNANNPPWFVSLRDPLDAARYPAYVERGTLALRPQLALQLLESRDRFSVDDVVALKYETRLLLADRVKPALIAALEGAAALSADAAAGLAALEAWDNRASAASRGTAVFLRFWDGYAAAVNAPYAVPWDPARPASTPEGLSNPAEAVRQFERAALAIRDAHGKVDVAWGEISRFRAGDLDLPGEGAPGTYGAYRVVRFDPLPDANGRPRDGTTRQGRQPPSVAGNIGGRLQGFGDAWVLVVDFSNPVAGHSVLAYGQTPNPASPHSRNQLRTFAERRLRRAWYTDAEIRANLERAYAPGK
ncbi:MAG: penicillin acylase family protein [Vicinamibacterales bacterium]